MGNQLSGPRVPGSVQDHLEDLPGFVFRESLGGGRLLKTLLAQHDNLGAVVVKVREAALLPGKGRIRTR